MGFEATYKKIDFGCFSESYTPSYSLGTYTSNYTLPPLFDFYSTGWNCGYSSYKYSGFVPSFSYAPLQTSYSPSTSFAPSTSSCGSSYSYSTKSFGDLTSTQSASTSRNYSYKAVASRVKQNLGPEFLAKVKQVAQNINCDYKDLLAVMNAESGLDASIQNTAGYQAYGLIQFQPDTARELGTSVQELVKMSPVKQLDYVEKFYLNARKTRGWGNKKLSSADLYALTLAPAYAKRDVLYVKGSQNYNANKNIDMKYGNANGKIEKSDLQAFINANRVNENIFVA